ncbi:carboxypeptidase-like regulatory domain-containing protein [Cochleicola gelatinilyticus]|uniref:Carboxypeptidase-like regulatory domain-containing protein n=1 Tax=Cochleicola gelatinilyticus TaxID=1763537 RepID=A0A167HPQ7_9FLAO|nr:carboxypeptidase-like regulatory domain-containing protein [Cochleicola gelatinilyticus]OAB78834.1 hypothetical protein ULVI_09645 [Cochleicola gelatinilyticus]
MKKIKFRRNLTFLYYFIFLVFFIPKTGAQELENFREYSGTVVNAVTGDPVEAVSLTIKDHNISTITNTDGAFTLKIPNEITSEVLQIADLGFQLKEISLSQLSQDIEIRLTPAITTLPEISILGYKDAEALVRKLFKEKDNSDINTPLLMTAFYRETIKRRNRDVSLTEAVVNLYKQPYASSKKDMIELHKARKSTDYKRLDTVALKLQGGPFSTLYLDMMKYPDFIFTDESIDYYSFNFEPSSTINGKPVYVIGFQPKVEDGLPSFKGKLFVASDQLALAGADFFMELGNTDEASKIFVKKKPRDIIVTPKEATYHIDYREKNGKWYYGYGSVSLSFKVNQKGKLFNSNYTISSEMAVTDWKLIEENQKPETKMKPTVVMTDEKFGFADPDFWGLYNVIEPEKSIESAINKIQRKLKRQ